jgi:hypothetical protein
MKEQVKQIIKSDEIKDLSSDIIESVIDSQITDEALQEIPIVKTIIAVKNIYNSYSDSIFIKKAMNVLLELSEVNIEERQKFISDLDSEYESGTEKILMAIDKLDSHRKCRVFGRLCKLKANEKIHVEDFLRISKVIQDAYLDDLHLITYLDPKGANKVTEEEYSPLISLDLIYQEIPEQMPIETNHSRYNEYDPEFIGGKIEFKYRLTWTGIKLHEIYYDLFPEEKI